MDKEFKPLEPQQPFGSFVYKKVGNTTISLDVFLPDNLESISTEVRVFLFIHGGAWIAGNRESYCRPLFDEFLSRGYAVITADYRLVPESSFQEQLEDIRDLEQWIRQDLPEVLANRQRGVRCGDIIVAGASAGAHVALLVPKLWKTCPAAILTISGPTNMHQLPYRAMGPLAGLEIAIPTSESLKAVTNYEHPPSSMPRSKTPQEWLNDRTKLGFYIFRAEIVAALLVRGLVRPPNSTDLALPMQSEVSKEEIDQISPLFLCQSIRYPPVYQIMGSEDSVFECSHVTEFAAALDEQGVPHAEHIVQGADHAFEMSTKPGDTYHLTVFKPAVEWICRYA